MGIVLRLPKPPSKPRPVDPNQPPPMETPSPEYAAKLDAFLTRKSPYDNPVHMRRFRTWSKADNFLGNNQWLRASYNVDPTRTPHWSAMEFRENDPDAIPTPTFNEMIGPHRNEAARLSRPEYKPYLRPTGKNPDAKTREACEFGAELLMAELERMGWDEETSLGFDHKPRYGGWALKSWWDVSWDETTRVAVLDAQRCPAEGCDFKVAKPGLSFDEALAVDQHKSGSVDREDVEGEDGEPQPKFSLKKCLTCDDHEEEEEVEQDVPDTLEDGTPLMGPDGAPQMRKQMVTQKVRKPGPPQLEPFSPVDEELQQQDSFDRPLGQDVPVGQWQCKTLSQYGLFWDNLAVGVRPNKWREVLEIHVEALDWVRARFPKKADLVKPEDAEALLKWHPVAGEKDIFFASASASGTGLFKDHVRVKEYHKKPYLEYDEKAGKRVMNKGRTIIVANKVVLLDGPYMLESKNNPGTFIPRVHYDYCPFDIRSGGEDMLGVSLAEYMFDAQEAINESKSQTQDTRQRMASPKWLVKRGSNLDYAETGNAGSHWLWEGEPSDPNAKPEEVGSTTISEGVAREIERDLEYIARAGNTREVEQGSVPNGVTAASAIQIMAEQAGEQRRPRIRRIRSMFKRVWRHGLMLLHEFVREPRTYHRKNEADEWSERSWTGLDVAGQFDVQIDPEPEHDTALQKRENMVKAVELKVLNPEGNKKAQMLIAKGLEVPSDLYEDDDLQYDSAQREYIDYLASEDAPPPVVDPDLDDHASHNDQHGTDMHNEKWKAIEREAGWRKALPLLWGWQGEIDGWVMAHQESAARGLPMPGETEPAQRLPPALQDQIIAYWTELLGTYGFQPEPQRAKAFARVMIFRAHKAAHEKMIEAATGAPAAAPGVATAPDGTAAPAPPMGAPPTSEPQPMMAGA